MTTAVGVCPVPLMCPVSDDWRRDPLVQFLQPALTDGLDLETAWAEHFQVGTILEHVFTESIQSLDHVPAVSILGHYWTSILYRVNDMLHGIGTTLACEVTGTHVTVGGLLFYNLDRICPDDRHLHLVNAVHGGFNPEAARAILACLPVTRTALETFLFSACKTSVARFRLADWLMANSAPYAEITMLEEMLGETKVEAMAMFPGNPTCQKMLVDVCRLHPTYAGQRRLAFRLIPPSGRAREAFLRAVIVGLEGRQEDFEEKVMASNLDPGQIMRACYAWAMGRRSKLAAGVEASQVWSRVRSATTLDDHLLEHLFVWLPLEALPVAAPAAHVQDSDTAATHQPLCELDAILQAVRRNPDVLTTAPDPTFWVGLLDGRRPARPLKTCTERIVSSHISFLKRVRPPGLTSYAAAIERAAQACAASWGARPFDQLAPVPCEMLPTSTSDSSLRPGVHLRVGPAAEGGSFIDFHMSMEVRPALSPPLPLYLSLFTNVTSRTHIETGPPLPGDSSRGA